MSRYREDGEDEFDDALQKLKETKRSRDGDDRRDRPRDDERRSRDDRDREERRSSRKDDERSSTTKDREKDRDRERERDKDDSRSSRKRTEEERERDRDRERRSKRDKERDDEQEGTSRSSRSERDREKQRSDRDRGDRRERDREEEAGGDVPMEQQDAPPAPRTAASTTTDSDGALSMSIEETNRLRVSLGLRPLDVGSGGGGKKAAAAEPPKKDGTTEAGSEGEQEGTEGGEKKMTASEREQADKLKVRLESARLTRQLRRVKTLGEASSSEDESNEAAAWVEKSRQRAAQRERELAELKARQLEEQERLLSMGRDDEAYTEDDLKGLKVAHDVGVLKEGEMTILTLKDTAIVKDRELNAEEDELENANLLESEKAEWNKKQKSTKTAYSALAELEENKQEGDVLKKYDEDQIEFTRKSFKLGQEEDEAKARRLAEIRSKLGSKPEASINKVEYSLTGGGSERKEVARDYMTVEEMNAKFKKPKKVVKKIRKKVKEEDEEAEQQDQDMSSMVMDQTEEGGSADRGSRQDRARKAAEAAQRAEEERKSRLKGYAHAIEKAAEKSKVLLPGTGTTSKHRDVGFEDDEHVRRTLSRANALKLKSNASNSEMAFINALERGGGDDSSMMAVVKKEEEDQEGEQDQEQLVFDSTSEFVRGIPTHAPTADDMFGGARDKKEWDEPEEEGPSIVPQRRSARQGEDAEMEEGEADQQGATGGGNKSDEDETAFLDETRAGSGVAAALSLFRQKGELSKVELAGRARDKILTAVEPGKSASAKGDVRIDYLDEFGRQMKPKEAFRYMSWIFHGKMPGKMKQEKRLKQFEEELKEKKRAEMEGGLMATLKKTQEVTNSPFLVLSGPKLGGAGGSSVAPPPSSAVPLGKEKTAKKTEGSGKRKEGPSAASGATSPKKSKTQ